MRQLWFGIVLYVILIFPPVTALLESVMILHMLAQLPLLIIVGWVVGKSIIERFHSFFSTWNKDGNPGILIILIITTYWMIPRAMDEALSVGYVEIFKMISLPIVGLSLRDSWYRLETIGKSFIFLNYLSMFGLMAWLYLDTPIQLCNNYLEFEQKLLGWGFLFITAFMVLYIIQVAFTDQSEATE